MPWVPRLFFLLFYRVFFFRNYFKRTNSVFTLRAFLFALPSLHPFILWIAQRRNQKLETRINSVTFSRLTLIGCCRFSTCPSRVTGARERNFKKKKNPKNGTVFFVAASTGSDPNPFESSLQLSFLVSDSLFFSSEFVSFCSNSSCLLFLASFRSTAVVTDGCWFVCLFIFLGGLLLGFGFGFCVPETTSDVSDVESRVLALTDQLQRRQAEAHRLKVEHQRASKEKLKSHESALLRQIEVLQDPALPQATLPTA